MDERLDEGLQVMAVRAENVFKYLTRVQLGQPLDPVELDTVVHEAANVAAAARGLRRIHLARGAREPSDR